MSENLEKHPSRQSIRLGGFDYSLPGAYFITICAEKMYPIFGEVVDGEMRLNDLGRIVESEWVKTPGVRREIGLGAFVVMPNHFHAIVHILEEEGNDAEDFDHRVPEIFESLSSIGRGDRPVARTEEEKSYKNPKGPGQKSIGALMAGFKSSATVKINEMRNSPGEKVWQRNYYEHIIRGERDYANIERYILENPMRWDADRFWRSRD